MEISVLVAKILSVGYLSLGLGILFNLDYYKRELGKLLDNSAILLYGGLWSIVLGFIIIEHHNTWHNDWTTIITVIGWIALLKGVSLLLMPNLSSFYKKNIFHPKYFSTVLIPLLITLGLLFGYLGFIR